MAFKHFLSRLSLYYKTFFKWLFCAVMVGFACGLVGLLFHRMVDISGELFAKYGYLLFFLPLAGVLIVVLYKRLHFENDSGTNFIFEAVRSGEPVPLRMVMGIFFGTVLTHLCGGSSGREGAALQIGGGLGSFFGRVMHMDDKDMRVMTLCGMSAVFSALFGTPITAAVFCLEVISIGVFYHSALIPCLLSSLTAYFFAKSAGVPPLRFTLSFAPETAELITLFRVVPLAILCAMLSILICVSLHNAGKLYKRAFPNPYLRIAAGGALVVLLTLLFSSRDYNGAGMAIITEAIGGKAVPYAFALKLLLTAATLGAGFKGGEIVPTMFIGATFGCAFAPLLGLDAGFGAAVGLIAVLCGVVNCPLSCMLLSVELFGGAYLIYFAPACAISYMLSGRFSLYSAQRFIYSKLETTYINEKAH